MVSALYISSNVLAQMPLNIKPPFGEEVRQSVKRRRFTVYTLWRLMINLKEVWRMTQLTLN